MNLEIIIETLDDDIVIPTEGENNFQFRHDGILLDGKLHFWEEILMVHITNKELINRLKGAK